VQTNVNSFVFKEGVFYKNQALLPFLFCPLSTYLL